MTRATTLLGFLFAMAAAAPAMAWTVDESSEGVQIAHQSNGLTIEMGCRAQRDGRLGVRITGLNADNIDVLTARIYQANGSTKDYDVDARGSSTTVEGRLNAPTDFLADFASGLRMQFLADGVLVMDTNLTGTSAARSRISAICGF